MQRFSSGVRQTERRTNSFARRFFIRLHECSPTILIVQCTKFVCEHASFFLFLLRVPSSHVKRATRHCSLQQLHDDDGRMIVVSARRGRAGIRRRVMLVQPGLRLKLPSLDNATTLRCSTHDDDDDDESARTQRTARS